MGKEFVVKHIRLKHAARMEQELSKVALGLDMCVYISFEPWLLPAQKHQRPQLCQNHAAVFAAAHWRPASI